MKITLETDFLATTRITPTLFVIYSILKYGSEEDFEKMSLLVGDISEDDIRKLIKAKLITIPKGKDISDLKFWDINENYTEASHPELWIDDFVELFPKGVRNKAGYYIRTTRGVILKKLIKFIKENKEFSNKEVILKATENYLNKQAMSGYQMCKMAPWFIEKDNVSILAAECQAIRDDTQTTKYENLDLV